MIRGICIPIVGPSHEEASEQLRRACQIGDGVEFRVDLFADVDVPALFREATVPVIFTIRTRGQGGRWEGPQSELQNQLRMGIQLQPAYLDVESGTELSNCEVAVLRSYHNFQEVPADVQRVLREPGSLHKIACLCRSGIEAMKLAQLASATTLTVGMGEDGLVARILAKIRRAPFTFGALDEGLQSAPGQPTAELLRNRYRYGELGPATQVFAVIGDPIAKSSGPSVYNLVFSGAVLDAVYLGIRVPRGEIAEFFRLAQQFPFAGLSVTMPHKQAVMEHLDGVDDVAAAIGAVNTVTWRDGQLFGTNTDAGGALDAIEAEIAVAGRRVAIVGAGGAARAITWEAIRRGADVVVVNRTVEKADDLARTFGCASGPLDILKNFKYDVLVQATSVGMYPHSEATPVPAEWLHPDTTVMDIVTQPLETRFLRDARERGCRIINGREMWIHQGVRQLAFWFPGHFKREEAVSLVRGALG